MGRADAPDITTRGGVSPRPLLRPSSRPWEAHVRAVRFARYGDIDVLDVVEVDRPKAGPGLLVVRVKAAGINPGEASIRKGLLQAIFPATFPSGQGTDLAGIVEEV